MVDSGTNDQPAPANGGSSRLWQVTNPTGAINTDPVALTGFDRATGFRITSATAVGDAYIWAPRIPGTPGEVLSLTGQLRLSKAGNYGFQAWSCDAAGNLGSIVAEIPSTATAAGAVVRGRLAPTIPAGAAGVRLLFVAWSLPASTQFDATAIRARRGTWPAMLYADGDTAGWEWVGARGDGTARYANVTTVIDLGAVSREALAPALAHDVTLQEPIGRDSTVFEALPLGIVDLGVLQREQDVLAVAHDVTVGGPIERDLLAQGLRRGDIGRVPDQPRLPGLRVLAQNIVTRRWLHVDVPIANLSIVKTLSGPQGITGDLAPVMTDVVNAGFAPWSTRFVVEDDEGQVRASAILVPPFAIDGDSRKVEAAGVSAYAQRETFDSEYSSYGVDPLDVVRMLWTHILTKPGRAPLKVTVGTATSKVRIGGYAPAANTGLSGPQTSPQGSTSSTEVPVYTISWWEGTKCGVEIDELARQVPFDYVERQRWNADRTDVEDRIEPAWPRLGRRRTDLRFAEGENVIDKITARVRDEDIADVVRLRGAGEGRDMIFAEASRPAPGRLPIVVDIQDSTVTNTARAKARAQGELRRRTGAIVIEKILVDARHPHAPWGSYDEGDDIPLLVDIEWIGVVFQWARIVGFTYTEDQEAVAIDLKPSDSFRYGTDD